MLQSMTDGKTELDRLYTNIMIAFGVPPQVFGKNVNTERHAAPIGSPRAPSTCSTTTSLLRSRLSAALNGPAARQVCRDLQAVPEQGRHQAAPILDSGFASLAIASAPTFRKSTFERT